MPIRIGPVGRRARPLPSRAEQLRAILAVLDDAVAAQPEADRVVAACGEPGPARGVVARDCGVQMSVYHWLNQRPRTLYADGDLAESQDRAACLLAYHQWMLHQSLGLAFPSHSDARTEAARLWINGLGAPADGLRTLRDELRAQSVTDGGTAS